MIARKFGSRYQMAFGHHRWRTAKQELGEDAKVLGIARDLSDEQMMQFFGRFALSILK